MNYLAHAYLSFGNEPVLAGNMISDFIKGKKQYEYPAAIQRGIRLHRAIDDFTDTHPATKELKKFFKPHYGLYAGAFIDIVYDYFLGNDINEFTSAAELALFSRETYTKLEKQLQGLPAAFQQVFVYMKQYDWLYNYHFDGGIQKSFAGMVRRAKYISESDTAFSIFMNNKESMQPYYDEFFPLLKNYCIGILNESKNID